MLIYRFVIVYINNFITFLILLLKSNEKYQSQNFEKSSQLKPKCWFKTVPFAISNETF